METEDGKQMKTDAAALEALSRQEISDALVRWCRGVDRCDVGLIDSVFHPDGIDEHGSLTFKSPFIGRELVRQVEASSRSCMHYVTNVSLTVEGDVAHSESYYFSRHDVERDGRELRLETSARCIDRW